MDMPSRSSERPHVLLAPVGPPGGDARDMKTPHQPGRFQQEARVRADGFQAPTATMPSSPGPSCIMNLVQVPTFGSSRGRAAGCDHDVWSDGNIVPAGGFICTAR